MSQPFRVCLTHDFRKADGSIALGDISLGILEEAPGIELDFMSEPVNELRPEDVQGYDAILQLAPALTAHTLVGIDRLALSARLGVGYDHVDLEACTEHGVLVTITPDGIRRPMATVYLTLILALSQRLLTKDQLLRGGRWAEKLDYMGMGLTGRVLGIVGLGNIGQELARLARPLEMQILASDPYVTEEDAEAVGARLVALDELMSDADFVCVACALTADTHHLIDRGKLEKMKREAYFINAARGPIVDEKALTELLIENRIAGAGLDVFEQEPPDPNNPLLSLDNVVLAPHALCWTDECFREMGRSAMESVLEVAAGRIPKYVVNRDVLESPKLKEKLARFATNS